ncbi:hypothetical protein [Parendozoicomonas sp. Alg238-R29]|uniref:hypothetical protein n=1 Tax=Parendozoicomonas sp. Alg238-R29 TaxID=2993446 RepID=UPI00248F1F4A|nr:hypothetical protein [Parendozoicomonas sp. Alg238-R29]
MSPLEIAEYYFKLSNDSNFEEITKLFSESSTFRSGKGELFLGAKDIMNMQRIHHGMYTKLGWLVESVSEIKPGIVHFVFDFKGETLSGEKVVYSGLEDVIIHNGKIQHIQVQIRDSLHS